MKKRIFKKNQIIVTALAILIAVAGYINYADSALKKEDSAGSASAGEEASAAGSEENSFLEEIESLDQDITDETAAAGEETTEDSGEETDGSQSGETASGTPGEAVLTTASTYMAQARFEREQTRSQN